MVKMKDIVTACLLKAKMKGKLNRLDLIRRYMRMKYSVSLSNAVLAKRIYFMELHKPHNAF